MSEPHSACAETRLLCADFPVQCPRCGAEAEAWLTDNSPHFLNVDIACPFCFFRYVVDIEVGERADA